MADGFGVRMLAETVTGGLWISKSASMGTGDEIFYKALEELQNTEPDDLDSPNREFVDIVMNICETRRLYRIGARKCEAWHQKSLRQACMNV